MATKKYVSTKEWIDAFPVAYRQWKADSHCNLNHGYSLSIKLYFEADSLDKRNWVTDFGGLKPLKAQLDEWFDHKTLVAEDDPLRPLIEAYAKAGGAKITYVEATGCEALADFLYEYINTIYLPNVGEQDRVWCYRVEVRETQSNMAFREGHREDGEFE